MTEESADFVNNDGQRLACTYWNPYSTPKALVLMCHGFADHTGWFKQLGEALALRDILAFGHDHVGHGGSDGDKWYTTDMDIYVRDTLQHADIIRLKYQQLPLFILGHSVGGLVALKAYLERSEPFSGVIVISPAIKPSAAERSPFKITVAKCLGKVLPKVGFSEIDPEEIARDKNVVKRYKEDQLICHEKIKCGVIRARLELAKQVEVRCRMITCPLLCIHGDQDKITDISGSQLLHNKVKSEDKTLSIYPDCLHYVHNEGNGHGDKCRMEITDWILGKINTQQ